MVVSAADAIFCPVLVDVTCWCRWLNNNVRVSELCGESDCAAA